MKKALSLILALVMCLSLCACGGGEQNNTTEGQNNAPSVEVPKELQEQISGDWAVVNPYDGAPQYINVFEGTMLAVDDMKYDMRYEGESRFSVWADDNYLGDITLRTEPNGNIYMTADVANYGDYPSFKEDCYKLGYDYVGEDVPGTEESAPQYTTVEITMDNWQDYFELKAFHDFQKNGFGELEGVMTIFLLITKDGIVCNRDECSITIERTITRETKSVTVDVNSETVIYGETTESKTGDPVVVTMNNASHWLGGDYDYYYGDCLDRNYIRNLAGDEVWVVTDINILRIAGSLTFYYEQ